MALQPSLLGVLGCVYAVVTKLLFRLNHSLFTGHRPKLLLVTAQKTQPIYIHTMADDVIQNGRPMILPTCL